MSKTVKIVAIVAGAIVMLGLVFGAAWLGTSLALGRLASRAPAFPMQPPAYGRGYPVGMMPGVRGGMIGGQYGPQPRWMADYRDDMEAAIAEGLGLTEEEFEARLADGETPWQIAQDQGINAEDFRTIIQDARAQVIAKAVEDGVITQEQADRLLDRIERDGFFMMGPRWWNPPPGDELDN